MGSVRVRQVGNVGLPLGFWAFGLHKGDGQLGLNWALSLFDFLGLNNWALDIKRVTMTTIHRNKLRRK